ncbi:hypothetical protein AXF42_Ash010992 [Apostasia shenzhenica]|uniref:HTH La-type RNA-binding domain-containing protein n=1 Tax=Apostasia shenzhenica TaxID=1088818 RepID=A0A2H9ZQT6_9ASPA|nr:hypothetical protein AXF42_Ash010992 [Apostasia shenzhenica]
MLPPQNLRKKWRGRRELLFDRHDVEENPRSETYEHQRERERRRAAMGDEKKEEDRAKTRSPHGASPSAAAAGFKFNAHAPEFVPSSLTPMSGYFCPYLQLLGSVGGGGMGPDLFYFADQEPANFIPSSNVKAAGDNKNSNDATQKILKQVEYQFSDTNLIASDFLLKIMNKDPEGYVPIAVIASWKKIKSLGVNNQMLIKALKTSTKLLVSEDGKKVRRKQLFTERDKEELMVIYS